MLRRHRLLQTRRRRISQANLVGLLRRMDLRSDPHERRRIRTLPISSRLALLHDRPPQKLELIHHTAPTRPRQKRPRPKGLRPARARQGRLKQAQPLPRRGPPNLLQRPRPPSRVEQRRQRRQDRRPRLLPRRSRIRTQAQPRATRSAGAGPMSASVWQARSRRSRRPGSHTQPGSVRAPRDRRRPRLAHISLPNAPQVG